jgi:hypothetical protein
LFSGCGILGHFAVDLEIIVGGDSPDLSHIATQLHKERVDGLYGGASAMDEVLLIGDGGQSHKQSSLSWLGCSDRRLQG